MGHQDGWPHGLWWGFGDEHTPRDTNEIWLSSKFQVQKEGKLKLRDHGCQCSRSEHPACGYFYPPCSYLMLWLNQTILTVNSFVLSHYFTEAWCVNQTVSKGEKKREREHIFFKWRKIWAFYNKHIFQRMSFSQSNYFTSPQDYWLHHTEKLREACFIFPIYLWFLCKLILVTMKNDKFAIWSKC